MKPTAKRQMERAVLRLAMADYRRLCALGWTGDDLGGLPRKLWDACARLARKEKR